MIVEQRIISPILSWSDLVDRLGNFLSTSSLSFTSGNSDKPVSSICPNRFSVGCAGYWSVTGYNTHFWEQCSGKRSLWITVCALCTALHLPATSLLTLALTSAELLRTSLPLWSHLVCVRLMWH